MNKTFKERLSVVEEDYKTAFSQVGDLETYGKEILPLLTEGRQEIELMSRLINYRFQSTLDITKATIIVILPALIAVLNINFENINRTGLVKWLVTILLVSIGVHLLAIILQIRKIEPLLQNSTYRLELYTGLRQTQDIKRKMKAMQREIASLKKR